MSYVTTHQILKLETWYFKKNKLKLVEAKQPLHSTSTAPGYILKENPDKYFTEDADDAI